MRTKPKSAVFKFDEMSVHVDYKEDIETEYELMHLFNIHSKAPYSFIKDAQKLGIEQIGTEVRVNMIIHAHY